MLKWLGFLIAVIPGFSQTAFTVTEVFQRYDAAGKLLSESRFLFAVKRDGSIVSVDLDPAAGSTRQVIDAAKGRTVVITPNAKSASEMRMSRPKAVASDACEEKFQSLIGAVVSVDRNAGDLGGVAVQRVAVVLPNGVEHEAMMAPSLGCQMLRAVTSQNGQVRERQMVENLVLGDPDPALFEVPGDYRITGVPGR